MLSMRKSVNLPPRVWEVRKQARNKLGQDSQELGKRLAGKRNKIPRQSIIILCLVKQERRNKYGVNNVGCGASLSSCFIGLCFHPCLYPMKTIHPSIGGVAGKITPGVQGKADGGNVVISK
jgi:hypothetical protein